MGTEKCPFCGQEIDAAATRCFFCGAELNKESVHKRLEQLHIQDLQTVRKLHKPLLMKFIAILILAGVLFFYGTSKRTSNIEILNRSSTVKLSAEVTLSGTGFMISNNDSFDWKNVRLEIIPESLKDRFSLRIQNIIAGKTYKADTSAFVNDVGIRFNTDKMKPKEFWILCDTPIIAGGYYRADWK